MKIFLICPVREVTEEENNAIRNYISQLEKNGHSVYWPFRDTNQEDPIGLRICRDNRGAIEEADEVHVWWNGKSTGSLFDLGEAFALRKKIVLANPETVQKIIEDENKWGVGKSFNKFLMKLHKEGPS